MTPSQPKRGVIITLNKNRLRRYGQFFCTDLYHWCWDNGILVKEPRDERTNLFKTFVIHLKTKAEQNIFIKEYPMFKNKLL